jgi:hypothetical protein
VVIETLHEEIRNRDRKLEQLLNEKNFAANEYERHLSELQNIIRDRESEIVHINDKFDVEKFFFEI